MPSTHTCPTCQTVHEKPVLNDDERIDPKIKLGQLIHLRDEQFRDVAFRVVKMEQMTLTLEKV